MMRDSTRRTFLVKDVSPYVLSSPFVFRRFGNSVNGPGEPRVIDKFQNAFSKLICRRVGANIIRSQQRIGFAETLTNCAYPSYNTCWRPKGRGESPEHRLGTAVADDKRLITVVVRMHFGMRASCTGSRT